jgi:cytochrome c-type biogenesis protein CcmH/NrfG
MEMKARGWALVSRVVALAALMLLPSCASTTPTATESLLRQGKEHFDGRRFDDAITTFQEVVKQDPKSVTAHVYLARAYGGKRAWPEAIAAGRKAYELAPDSPETALALTGPLFRGGLDAIAKKQFAEATARLSEYVTLKPNDLAGYMNLGQASLDAGKWEAALDAYRRGLEKGTEGPDRDDLVDALLDGGNRALEAGDGKTAASFLREYVRIDQFNTFAYLLLGKAYRLSGDKEGALGAFRRVLELNPRDSEALQFVKEIGR